MYRQARRVALPPPTVRLPRILPLSRLNGATPTRAAAWRRVSEPSSGSSAGRVRALTGPTARHRAPRRRLGPAPPPPPPPRRPLAPPRCALPDRRAQVALDPGQRLPEPAQVGVDPLAQGGI